MRYNYNGHEIDVFPSVCGYIAYLDCDLEPHTISEKEYLDVVMYGEFISYT